MIDILMATYNGEKYLKKQIESIIGQSFTEWNLIIRDDGSTDGTLDILKRYESAYPTKIHVRCNPVGTGSAKANFFKLLHDAQNEYVMFCDQDDIWNSDKIQLTLKKIKQMEKSYGTEIPLLVATDLSVADAHGKTISNSFLEYMNLPKTVQLNHLLIQNNITGCTVMINAKLCQMLKKVRDVELILMHDHFAAIVAVLYGKAELVQQSTLLYRQHETNSVGAMNAKSLKYMLARFKRGRKKFQQDIDDSMNQAGYVLRLYGKRYRIRSNYHKRLIMGYSRLINQTRMEKYNFYLKYHVFKHGWIRKIMQLIWS